MDPDGESVKLIKATFNILKKTYKHGSLKKAGKDELLGIYEDISELVDGDLSIDDFCAAVDLVTRFGKEAKKRGGNLLGGSRTKHIENRHINRTKYPDKSKFKKPNQIEKINLRTIKKTDRVIKQGQRTRYEEGFGREIGRNGERTNVTVIDNKSNKRVTQFPTTKE